MQVTALRAPPWTVLDAGELQLKLQLSPFDPVAHTDSATAHADAAIVHPLPQIGVVVGLVGVQLGGVARAGT